MEFAAATPPVLVPTYVSYLVLSTCLTVWAAGTLFKNGRVFLVSAFKDQALADSVNHLLVVGFYLINLGYVTLNLKVGLRPEDLAECIEVLSHKLGCVAVVLGGMHFFNLYVFARIRRAGTLEQVPPPVAPQHRLTAA
jgi:hypothetical protein